MVPPANINQQSTNYVNSYDHEQENATNVGVPANSFPKKILILSTLKLKKHTESAGKNSSSFTGDPIYNSYVLMYSSALGNISILLYFNFPINTWKSGSWLEPKNDEWNPRLELDTKVGWTLPRRPHGFKGQLNHPSYYLDSIKLHQFILELCLPWKRYRRGLSKVVNK